MRRLLSFIPMLWAHWLSVLGTVITSFAGLSLLLGTAIDLASPISHQYTLTLLFLVLPVIFVFGLLLIPLGFWRAHKRGAVQLSADNTPLRYALGELIKNPKARKWMTFIIGATAVNIILVGAAGARMFSYLDSPEFCGTMCHTVMQPEYESYLQSPHAKVECVRCHIGPGASWAAKAKIDGLRQVWAVATDSYSTPIPSPVEHLRPARDTCEQCHWPAKFLGTRLAVYRHYEEDRENTEMFSVVALKIGGENPTTGKYQGIHWHVSPSVEVQYEVLDERREQIGRIAWYDGGKKKGQYDRPDKKKTGKMRVMDCVDCHNRPTHIFDADAKQALDRALREGMLDKKMPYIRKVGATIIQNDQLPSVELEAYILKQMKKEYQKLKVSPMPDEQALKKSAKVLASLYRRNVFPKMKVTWGTHPNHLGHPGGEDAQNGCFRCHNDEHADAKGNTLSQDCDLCHSLLNYEESLDDLSDEIKEMLP